MDYRAVLAPLSYNEQRTPIATRAQSRVSLGCTHTHVTVMCVRRGGESLSRSGYRAIGDGSRQVDGKIRSSSC